VSEVTETTNSDASWAIFKNLEVSSKGGPNPELAVKSGNDNGLAVQAPFQKFGATLVSQGVYDVAVKHFDSVQEAEEAAAETTTYAIYSKGAFVKSSGEDDFIVTYAQRAGLISPSVDEKTIKLRSFFNQIDVDKSGTIEYSEFVDYVTKNLTPKEEKSVIHARLQELEKKIADKPALFQDKRHSHQLKLIKAEELPVEYGENKLFKCDGCSKKGRGLVYHCTEEDCTFDLHVDCAGDYVAYDAEQKALRTNELKTAFASVRAMGKLMGLTEKEVQEIEFQGQSVPKLDEFEAAAEAVGQLATGLSEATQECAQQ